MNKFIRFSILFVLIYTVWTVFLNANTVNSTNSSVSSDSSDDSETTIFTTEITDSSNLWPKISSGFSYYKPTLMGSEDEAMSTIRSSMGYVNIGGNKPYDVTVDKYSAIYKMEWTENTSYKEDVPTTGGFFIGWDYIPTFSSTTQTYHQSEQKHDSMTINFKQVKDIYFYNSTLCLESDGAMNYISADSADRLKPLADAIYTLDLKEGGNPQYDMLFSTSHLTSEQCKKLNIDNGEMVTSLFKGSEADIAGIREGDIILNFDKFKAGGMFAKKYFSSGNSLKILRWKETGLVIKYKKIEIKLKGGK